jgi:hypothetical protein
MGKTREASFSNSRREEGVERAQRLMSNAEVGKEARGTRKLNERSEETPNFGQLFYPDICRSPH